VLHELLVCVGKPFRGVGVANWYFGAGCGHGNKCMRSRHFRHVILKGKPPTILVGGCKSFSSPLDLRGNAAAGVKDVNRNGKP
jgi:hypothetical protein